MITFNNKKCSNNIIINILDKIRSNKIYVMLKKKLNVYIVLIVISLIGVFIVMTGDNTKESFNINGKSFLKSKGYINVYISGAVKKEGVLRIKKGTLLEGALNDCGGITKNADVNRINFKQRLKNGDKIIITENRWNDIGEIHSTPGEKTEKKTDNSGKININTADIGELESLQGIGKTMAQRIIDYRKSDKFYSIEDIMKVSGIGEGRFNKIKEKICTN